MPIGFVSRLKHLASPNFPRQFLNMKLGRNSNVCITSTAYSIVERCMQSTVSDSHRNCPIQSYVHSARSSREHIHIEEALMGARKLSNQCHSDKIVQRTRHTALTCECSSFSTEVSLSDSPHPFPSSLPLRLLFPSVRELRTRGPRL